MGTRPKEIATEIKKDGINGYYGVVTIIEHSEHSTNELRDKFGRFGRVMEVNLAKNNTLCFVFFERRQDAHDCWQALKDNPRWKAKAAYPRQSSASSTAVSLQPSSVNEDPDAIMKALLEERRNPSSASKQPLTSEERREADLLASMGRAFQPFLKDNEKVNNVQDSKSLRSDELKGGPSRPTAACNGAKPKKVEPPRKVSFLDAVYSNDSDEDDRCSVSNPRKNEDFKTQTRSERLTKTKTNEICKIDKRQQAQGNRSGIAFDPYAPIDPCLNAITPNLLDEVRSEGRKPLTDSERLPIVGRIRIEDVRPEPHPRFGRRLTMSERRRALCDLKNEEKDSHQLFYSDDLRGIQHLRQMLAHSLRVILLNIPLDSNVWSILELCEPFALVDHVLIHTEPQLLKLTYAIVTVRNEESATNIVNNLHLTRVRGKPLYVVKEEDVNNWSFFDYLQQSRYKPLK